MVDKSKQMRYWRDTAFKSLKDLEKSFKSHQKFSLLAEYADLKEKGLRQQSLDKLNEFIQVAEDFSDNTRREFVHLYCQKRLEFPMGDYIFDSYHLTNKIINPTLRKWTLEEPENPEPLKWIGLFYWNPPDEYLTPLEKSLQLSPQDDSVRIALIGRYLCILDEFTEHIDKDIYRGDLDEDLQLCEKAKKLLNGVQNQQTKVSLTNELAEYQKLIADWLKKS